MLENSMQDISVPFITLPNWIKAAAYCGFNIDPIFSQHGIEADLRHLEDASIRISTLNDLMLTCVNAANTSGRGHHFPFILGETFTFEYLPEMETYINTSGTLREASKVLTWVHELISPFVDIQLEENNRIARMVLVYPHQGTNDASPLSQYPYTSESFFATLIKFTRMLMGNDVVVRLLRFRHAPPDYASQYDEFFHIPVAFNQQVDCLEFDQELLDIPLHGNFPALHHQAEQLVEQRLARQSQRHGMAAQLHRLFENDSKLLAGPIDPVAAQLNMHPRSLQRRLQAEGTSFAELQSEARLAVSVKSLQHSRESLDSLSDRLGFSDRRSFTRAFKRWTGVSPSQYRRNL